MKEWCVIGALFNVLDVSEWLGAPPKRDHPLKPLTWTKGQVCGSKMDESNTDSIKVFAFL